MKEKTREQIANQYYLCRSDIEILLGIGRGKAVKTFDLASALDDEEFKEYRIEPNKVSMKSVLKIHHLTLKDLKGRINEKKDY